MLELNNRPSRAPLSIILRNFLYNNRDQPNEFFGFITWSKIHGLRHQDWHENLGLYNMANIEKNALYPPPIRALRSQDDTRQILPLYKIYDILLQDTRLCPPIKIYVMTKREFIAKIREELLDNFHALYHPLLDMGKDLWSDFAQIAWLYLWILHGYTCLNFFIHIKRQPSDIFQDEIIANNFAANKEQLEDIILTTTNHLQSQLSFYFNRYAPFVERYKKKQQLQQFEIDKFKVIHLCSKIKETKESNGLINLLQYDENNKPQYTHPELVRTLVNALAVLENDNNQDLQRDSVRNNNKQYSRCRSLKEMIKNIQRWLTRRMFIH